MQPSFHRLKKQISELAQIDFSKNWLVPDQTFVHAEQKSGYFGRIYKQLIGEKKAPLIEQSLVKIRQILKKHPKLLTNLKTVTELLTLGANLTFLVDKLPPSQGARLYDTLENFEFFLIKQALAHDKFTHLTLEESFLSLKEEVSNENFKGWVQFAKERIEKKRNTTILENVSLFAKENPEAIPAATKIQRFFRGWKTRQDVVLPSQILPFLEQHLLEKSSLLDVARGLCREINKMSLNPQKYRGRSIRLEKLSKSYLYPILDQHKKIKIKLDFNCWLEMSEDGKTVTLLIIPGENSKIGSGSYKIFHKAQKFNISFRLDKGKRSGTYENKVLFQLKDKELLQGIIGGLNLQKMLIGKIGEGAKIAGIPRRRLPSANRSDNEPFEREQEWYNSSLDKAILTSTVPLDLSLINVRKLTIEDKFTILLDIATSLKLMHKLGYVHRDVKPGNILIKADEEHVEGFLSDFDFSCYVGKDNLITYYPYWDQCAEKGFVTPFCDVFGLGMSLGEMLIPDFCAIMADLTIFQNKEPLDNLVKAYALRALTQVTELSSLRLKLESLKTSSEIHLEVSNFFDQNSSGLSKKLKRHLRKLDCELNVVEAAFNLILTLVYTDHAVYNMVNDNLEIKRLLTSSSMSDRHKAVNKLTTEFPLTSMENFITYLIDLKEKLSPK